MAADHASGHDDIAELRRRIHEVEERVAQLERGAVISSRPAPTVTDQTGRSRIDTDRTVASVFTRVAMLSFVLLGALILRILTQQHVLGPRFGTVLGFAYAGHLIVLSFLPGAPGRFARTTSLFQCCGILLSFGIALESARLADTLTRPTAMILIGGFTALALGVAAIHRKASLAGIALVGGMLALVALGLEAEGLALQVSLLAGLAAFGALLSWRYAWRFIRPLIYPLLMVLLSVGLVLAHKESLGNGALYASAIALWFVLASQHLLAFRHLGSAAVWLPLATGWMALLAYAGAWPALAYAAAGVSALATLGMVRTARSGLAATGGASGLAATAVIAGAIGWPMLDSSGVLCALAGAALWAVARNKSPYPLWAPGSTAILMMVATARGLFQLVQAGASPYALLGGMLLAAILALHFLSSSRSRVDQTDHPTPCVSVMFLAGSLLVLLAVIRGILLKLIPDPASLQLAQTGLLSVTAVTLTLWGRAGNRRPVLYAGLACMFLSLLKVGLVDLGRLSGLRLLASIILLGLSSVGVSVILRRRD